MTLTNEDYAVRLDMESWLNREVPCMVIINEHNCPVGAEWRITHTCGHSLHTCDGHKDTWLEQGSFWCGKHQVQTPILRVDKL